MMRLMTGLKLVAAREVAATRAAPPATMVTPDTRNRENRFKFSLSYLIITSSAVVLANL